MVIDSELSIPKVAFSKSFSYISIKMVANNKFVY